MAPSRPACSPATATSSCGASGAALAGWAYLVAWGALAAANAGHARQIGVAIGAVFGLLVLQQVLRIDGRD